MPSKAIEVSEATHFVNLNQLDLFLTKGFAIASDQFEFEYQTHPQDISLIHAVAGAFARRRTDVLIAPYCNSLSLAFLARAIAVGTVGKPPLAIYSPDGEFRRTYRRLSYIANRIKTPMSSIYPLTRPGKASLRILCCDSLKDLEHLDGEMSLLVDARTTRGWRNLADPPWKRILGPKVFLMALEDEEVAKLIAPDRVEYCRGVGKTAIGWPAPLRDFEIRDNNYSKGVSFQAEVVPGQDAALATLETSLRNLLSETRGVENLYLHVNQAERLNYFVQNSVLPLTMYQNAANGLGRYSIPQMLSFVKTAGRLEMSQVARIAFYRYTRAAEIAMKELSLRHPQKVAWLRHFLLDSRQKRVYIYCRSGIEEDAVRSWNESEFSTGCAELVVVSRRDIRKAGFDFEFLVPGPPSGEESANMIGGVSRNVRVLVYLWQARNWNSLIGRISPLLSRTQPIPEVEFEQQDQVAGIDWSIESIKPGENVEGSLEEEAVGDAAPQLLVPTDSGTLELDEGALVPTLDVDKFVDTPARLLQVGNVIILRTGGNAIDTRKMIDALAAAHPVLSEAAFEASLWRDVLKLFVKSRGFSAYRQIHDTLFPHGEVTYGTVRSWILNQAKIAPNNRNLALLLERMGISEKEAETMANAVHVYRGLRMKAYHRLFLLWNKYAGRLYEFEEDEDEADEKVDPELGLSLASLEQLVTFAKVTDKPRPKERLVDA